MGILLRSNLGTQFEDLKGSFVECKNLCLYAMLVPICQSCNKQSIVDDLTIKKFANRLEFRRVELDTEDVDTNDGFDNASKSTKQMEG